MNVLSKSRKDAGIYLLSALVSFVLLSSGLAAVVVADSFTPHVLAGYAQYSGASWAEGATIDAHNDDTNDWIYNADIVDSSGQWDFNVGSPGPSWSVGDQATIYAEQKGTENYQGWSGHKTITINSQPLQDCGTITLNPPPSPSTPSVSGPTTGNVGISYSFDATSTDPNSIDIKYLWDWNNDGSVDEESGWMSSGSTDTRSHSWSSAGTKNIKVKARNKGSQESGWESHTINISNIFISNLSQEWNFLSLPFNQSIGKTALIISYNGTEYTWQQAVDNGTVLGFIYRWNSTTQNYETIDTLHPGHGYWMYAYYNCSLWVQDIETSIPDNYINNLETQWNMIGIPVDEILEKQNLTILYNGTVYSWKNATTSNNEEGEPLILSFIYGWNATSQNYETSEVLLPGKSFWMYAFYECTLKRDI
jgi:hypothetical protein